MSVANASGQALAVVNNPSGPLFSDVLVLITACVDCSSEEANAAFERSDIPSYSLLSGVLLLTSV